LESVLAHDFFHSREARAAEGVKIEMVSLVLVLDSFFFAAGRERHGFILKSFLPLRMRKKKIRAGQPVFRGSVVLNHES
jgi:hypothetical protein